MCRYESHREMVARLVRLQEQFPAIARVGPSQSDLCITICSLQCTVAAITTQVGQIGQSVQGRALVYIKLSAGVERRKLLEPMVKYVGNMHGNEAVSRWNSNSIFVLYSTPRYRYHL